MARHAQRTLTGVGGRSIRVKKERTLCRIPLLPSSHHPNHPATPTRRRKHMAGFFSVFRGRLSAQPVDAFFVRVQSKFNLKNASVHGS